jgi:hypothetical protein
VRRTSASSAAAQQGNGGLGAAFLDALDVILAHPGARGEFSDGQAEGGAAGISACTTRPGSPGSGTLPGRRTATALVVCCWPVTPPTCTFPPVAWASTLGFQDAMNLGWKLAAVVQGRASDGLLDSYHAERHPVGVRLLADTRAQTALITAFSPEGRALRGVLGELLARIPAIDQLLTALRTLGVRFSEPSMTPDRAAS